MLVQHPWSIEWVLGKWNLSMRLAWLYLGLPCLKNIDVPRIGVSSEIGCKSLSFFVLVNWLG